MNLEVNYLNIIIIESEFSNITFDSNYKLQIKYKN